MPTTIYLACPYTSPDPTLSQARYELVTKVAGWLMQPDCFLGRYVVFSPITHSHPVAELSDIPQFDWDFWQYQDFEMIERCDEFWVLRIPGWRESVGVTDEIQLASELRKPYRCLFIGALPPALQILAEKLS